MSADARGSFDRVAKIYDATRGRPPEAEAAMGNALAAILRSAGDPPRVLEIGVGTGRIALPIAARGCHVTGVDIAGEMLAELRRKGRSSNGQESESGDLALVRGSASDLPFASGAFDAALFVHVLHLVPDPGATVRGALRSVRGGGLLAFANDDLPRESIWGESRHLLRESVAQVCGVELKEHAGHVHAIEAMMTELERAGASSERQPLAAWQETFRGRDQLAQLEGRMMSWMWPIPDEQIPALIAHARPRLEALCGGLDRAHSQPRSMSALVARVPESHQ